jgi:hypothetical protein
MTEVRGQLRQMVRQRNIREAMGLPRHGPPTDCHSADIIGVRFAALRAFAPVPLGPDYGASNAH